MRSSLSVLLLVLFACRDHDSGDPQPEDTAITSTEATLGVSCSRTERVGWIDLSPSDTGVVVSGRVYSAPEPLTGQPILDNEHCAYHRYVASACGPCVDPLVCSGSGNCVPWPLPFEDLELVGHSGGGTYSGAADPGSAYLYEQWAGAGEDWALELSFGLDRVAVPAMRVATGDIDLLVTAQGDYDTPGAIAVSWTPVDDGSMVRTEIPINHHAQPGTFTLCEAGAEVGGFTADAEMVDPLAVTTGLEFQGVSHLYVASAQTSVGCVELRYGVKLHLDPEWGR